MKKIFVFLFDGFADWEIAYLSPEINKCKDFQLIYLSIDGHPIISMGGIQVLPTASISQVNCADLEMLILPGGIAWEKEVNEKIKKTTKKLHENGKSIAAICAATTFFGRLGILDEFNHTSNDLNYLKEMATNYTGDEHYQNSLAVTDRNIITANGIAPIEFAREIFKKIELYGEDDIEKWFDLFKNGIWNY